MQSLDQIIANVQAGPTTFGSPSLPMATPRAPVLPPSTPVIDPLLLQADLDRERAAGVTGIGALPGSHLAAKRARDSQTAFECHSKRLKLSSHHHILRTFSMAGSDEREVMILTSLLNIEAASATHTVDTATLWTPSAATRKFLIKHVIRILLSGNLGGFNTGEPYLHLKAYCQANVTTAGLPTDLVSDDDERWSKLRTAANDIFSSARHDIKEKIHASLGPPVPASDNDDDLDLPRDDSAQPLPPRRREQAWPLFKLCKTLTKLRTDANLAITPSLAVRVALLRSVYVAGPQDNRFWNKVDTTLRQLRETFSDKPAELAETLNCVMNVDTQTFGNAGTGFPPETATTEQSRMDAFVSQERRVNE